MTLGLWPDAVPFDDQVEDASDELRKHFDTARLPGAVLVVCSRGLRGSAWAARSAIGLARAMSGSDRPVVLADLDFESPCLHEAVAESNAEGLADALLFGASLERVTTRPSGEAFEFVPPGGYAPDPLELVLHPAWSRLLAELASRNALLLAFAPIGVPGLDVIAERITSVIVLAGEDDLTQTVALLPETIKLEGVIRPPVPAPVPEPEPVPAVLQEETASASPVEPLATVANAAFPSEGDVERVRTPKDEAREALIAEVRARQYALDRSGEQVEDRSAEHAPSPVQAQRVPSPLGSLRPNLSMILGRPRWGVIGFIVALAAIGFLIGRLLAGGSDIPVGTASPITAGGPAEPAGAILGYSVAVESYDQLPAALARADSLSMLDSVLTYYIAPVLVDGMVFYRVMAGPLPDSAAAAVALSRLLEEGWKATSNAWDVRTTPLAFFLGRFDSREAAVQRMRELSAQGVPSYVVDVPYSSGPVRYHLYGGAYSADSEAAVMRDLLKRVGVTDTLMLRLGRGAS